MAWKKVSNKRKVEKAARKNRALTPEGARRAEQFVMNQWAEVDRRRKEREEAFELQEISYGTVDGLAEPQQAYRHPRMDWK